MYGNRKATRSSTATSPEASRMSQRFRREGFAVLLDMERAGPVKHKAAPKFGTALRSWVGNLVQAAASCLEPSSWKSFMTTSVM